MQVKVFNNDINSAIRKLKKKVFSERILIDYMRHQAYEKPSIKRRRKMAESILRVRSNKKKEMEERGY